MILRIISAMTIGTHIIGKNGKLPWKYPRELAYFKDMTTGYPMIMGRKTFESFKAPLPNREHLVLTTQNKQSDNPQVKYFTDIDSILEYCEEKEGPVYVIGGATVYQSFLPLADELYLTFIQKQYDGDTIFPIIDWNDWGLESSIKDTIDPIDFCIFKRKEE